MTERKILHAADIHLDSPLQRLGSYESAPVERIRSASRRALQNMVDLGIDQAVDLVVIAGDLFDGDWPDQNTGLFFVSQVSKLVQAGIPLVVIRGNHDAANIMTSSLRFPTNPDGSEIMMSADQVDLRRFERLGVAVHGRSFKTRAETGNMAAEYPNPISGMLNLGLLHTSLTGAEGHDSYAPCTPAQLADKHYDYWALGHVHTFADHGSGGSAPIVFSGNIQGRHIRETGAKGCVIVRVDPQNRCQLDFHELDVVRWQLCRIDTSALQHSDEIIDAFQAWMTEALSDCGDRLLVVRVELVGDTSLHQDLIRESANLKGSLQATTVTHGRDQVWLEALKVRTSAESARAIVDLDGPQQSLRVVVDQLRGDPSATIEHELRSLVKKLPLELGTAAGALPIDDETWVAELIETALADVENGLSAEGAEHAH